MQSIILKSVITLSNNAINIIMVLIKLLKVKSVKNGG